jgi:predicted P-loop ATPase
MTPHERAVRAVETPGWLVKETTPADVDLPRGARATVNVETVTLRGSMLTELIEKEITEAMDAERDRVLYAVRDVAGLEVALKVQDATVPPWASQAPKD